MAGQSITFDFLTTGADRTAGGFRKVADNTVLAARGAKVLSNAIETLGQKENRTAAESALLAKALRQTGDAEDRVAARAVVADAAIRRLDDAMQDSTKHSGELRKSLGGLKLNPGLLGPALLLAPAMTTLAGVAAGAGVALGGAFTAAAGALAGFGAIAKPILTDAAKASEAVGKAQDAYNTAISQGVPKAKAFKAEQLAIATAYAGMSPAQIALSKQLGGMADAWDKVKAAETPVVAGALQPWLKSITGLMGMLKPIIDKIAPVIKDLGDKFSALVKSDAAARFRDFVATFGALTVKAAGSTLIDFFKAFMIILPQFAPLIGKAAEGIAGLGPAVLKWASSKKTADHITAFMDWFKTNGPLVGELIKNVGGALAALAPGLTAGAATELNIISKFFEWVAKLPPAIAKPLIETAGALLLLNKLGVISVGVKIVGAAAKWLSGGLINIGGGATAAAAMRTAMVSGGAAAAAEIRAAMTGGAPGAGAAGKSGAPAAAAGGSGVWAAAGLVAAGAFAGALIRGLGDKLSPKGTFAGNLNKQFQADGQLWSTSLLHSFTFGGLEGWLTARIGLPVGNFLNGLAAGAKTWGGNVTHTAVGAFANIAGGAKTWWGNITGTVSGAWKTITGQSAAGGRAVSAAFGAAGRAADALRTRNLVPLLGQTGKVSGGIQGLSRYLAPGLAGAMDTGGRHANAFRTNNLGPLRGELAKDSGGVQGLQGLINRMHGTTVHVNFVGSGSGSIAFKQSIPGVTTGPSSQGILGFHAAGGRITGGTPGRDSVLGMLMPGEVVVPTQMVNAGAVDHLRGQLPGFAAGGAVNVTGAVGANGMFTAGQPFMANAEARFGRAVEGAFARAAIAKFKADMKKAQAAGSSVPGGGGGAARWKNQIITALAMLGQPASLLGAVEHRMNQESGGNQFAVNRWDSNWAAGTPSVGVMQVIGPTYASNSPAGWRNLAPMAYGVSEDVLANTYAGLHHAITAYRGRSLASVMMQPGGYAKGGLVRVRVRRHRRQAGADVAERVEVPARRRTLRRARPRRRQRADRPDVRRGRPGEGPRRRGRPVRRPAPVLGEHRRRGDEAPRRAAQGTDHRTGVALPAAAERARPRPADPRSREPPRPGRARPRVESPDGPRPGHHRGHQQDAGLLRRVPEGASRAQARPESDPARGARVDPAYRRLHRQHRRPDRPAVRRVSRAHPDGDPGLRRHPGPRVERRVQRHRPARAADPRRPRRRRRDDRAAEPRRHRVAGPAGRLARPVPRQPQDASGDSMTPARPDWWPRWWTPRYAGSRRGLSPRWPSAGSAVARWRTAAATNGAPAAGPPIARCPTTMRSSAR